MIKEPLYSNIIMSIKFAKRFKHCNLHHTTPTLPPLYQLHPLSDNSAPTLTYHHGDNKREALNTKIEEDWEVEGQYEGEKTLGFYEFPTNISEFEEVHEELNLTDSPTFSYLPSLAEEVANRSHQQRQIQE